MEAENLKACVAVAILYLMRYMVADYSVCDINRCLKELCSQVILRKHLPFEEVCPCVSLYAVLTFQGMCGSRSADNLSCPSPLNVMEPVSLFPSKSLGRGAVIYHEHAVLSLCMKCRLG